jgi:hypothetical protein
MIRSSKPSESLRLTDPPILLAGLIAAKRSGDRLLATVLQRELQTRFRIAIRFLSENQADREATGPEAATCR